MNLAERITPSSCPYLNSETGACVASCSGLEIDEGMKMNYCLRKNYDNCPILLVRNLIKKHQTKIRNIER